MAMSTDLTESLTMDEIPVKLRCAACNQLANNAFRMPCCDQSICEACQSSLPQACPVCLHEPVKADDCRPNKALRTTIKVFLRKKGIEREAARKKELVGKAAAVPAAAATPLLDATPDIPQSQNHAAQATGDTEAIADGDQASIGVSQASTTANGSKELSTPQIPSVEDQMDIPRPSIEAANGEVQIPQDNTTEVNGVLENGSAEQGLNHEQHSDKQEQWGATNGHGPLMSNGSFGFDGTNAGFPPNMGFNGTGDFGQMMQFMPSSMQANSMGAFPNMMAMPGMGMDPMALSQGMYGGFGGQGMGMNGMNISMGFNAGQSAFGGFDGQPAAWNAGQDKFNQNAYGGHATGMGGDFGANAGYGGYNMPHHHQGNFTQMHQHQYQNNDFQNGYNGQGFHNRGRGRGRGYQTAARGRGDHHQVNPGNQANYEPFHHQIPQPLVQQDLSHQRSLSDVQKGQEQPKKTTDISQDEPDAESKVEQVADEQLAKELEPGDVDDGAENGAQNGTEKIAEAPPLKKSLVVKEEVAVPTEVQEHVSNHEQDRADESSPQPTDGYKPAAIETFISSDPKKPEINQAHDAPTTPSVLMPPPIQTIPLGPAALYSMDHPQDFAARGRGAGRGLHRGTPDYRNGLRGRNSSFGSNGLVTPLTSVQPVPAADTALVIPPEPKGLGVEGAPKAPRALRDGLPNTGMRGRGFSIVGRASSITQARPNGHARSRSPSPARSRSRSRHHTHRHRTHRHRSTSSSDGSEREKRRERHRRHSRKHEEDENRKPHEVKDSRSRDKSADSSRRSSHRSHREHGKERDSGRNSHRSYRSQRERSRDREGESYSGRRRSRSPGLETNGAKRSVVNQSLSPTDNRQKEKNDEPSQSSRKRRDREDEERHRERKRSRRDRSPEIENVENAPKTAQKKRDEEDARLNQDRKPILHEKPIENFHLAAKKPETDPHTLEREARNKERLLKELQRREAMEGSAGKRRDSNIDGRSVPGSRRVSYKYEDEESNEARASRVESEREAGRWR